MKKVSMQDIADKLGISRNSVSQALRDTDGVSDETKKEVLKVAQELGYEYKRKIKITEQGSILLLATSFALSQTSFFGEIIDSIKYQTTKNGFSLKIETITEQMIKNMELPKDIDTNAGIILLSHSNNDYINKILNLKLPTILVDHHDPSLLVDTVLSKNTDGAYKATTLLIENQHKKIGFIGDVHFSPSYLERYRGYKRALDDAQLTREKNVEIISIEESQGALFKRLNDIQEMPDAWFCVNSGLAFMLNYYLQSSGYIIPNDISVICFDDTEFTRTANPTITNIATDLKYMGKLAVQILMKRIDGDTSPFVHTQIVPSLNIRESVRIEK